MIKGIYTSEPSTCRTKSNLSALMLRFHFPMESQVAPCLKMLPSFAWQKCINLRVNRLDMECGAIHLKWLKHENNIQNTQQSSCSAEAVSSHPSKTSPVRIEKWREENTCCASWQEKSQMHPVIMVMKPNKAHILGFVRTCPDCFQHILWSFMQIYII